MIEPSEDSFETMMELKNPSSKQMESSEGSSNTVEETPGSIGAQAEAGPASGPAQESNEPPSGSVQEMQELPIDLLQDMEEPSSGPCKEIEDPPNDLLQDMEESCSGSRQARADPLNEASEGMEDMSVNLAETQEEQEDETNLKEPGKEEPCEAESQPGSSPGEVLSTMSSIISLFLRMQDLNEQQKIAEEILVRGINEGRLPSLRHFSGDRRDYQEFIVLCQMILQSYPTVFYNDHLRVNFVIRHLSGLALEWAKALLQENSPLMYDFSGFLEAMSKVFEYRQTLRVAEEAMFNIRQGNRCATDYINEFQSLVPTLGWPDEVLQAHLCQGLNEDIRHYLFRIPQPDSLNSLIVVILQIEDKLAERRALLRLPPESRPRNLTWIDSPAPERWMVSSWLPNSFDPDIDRAHLFLLLLVRVSPYHSVAVQALVDSGAEGNYMDEKFAQEHYVELYEKPYPQLIQTVDGSLIGDEPVWLYTEPLVCIHQNHQESIQFDIVPSPNFSVVLGISWLRTHAPEVDWIKGRCTFHSPYCLKNCFRPPPPCIALEKYSFSLLPGLPHTYSDLADVFNPREADDETSDQPSSDGSDDLSESEPSELQQAGDSDHSDVFYECPSSAPWEPVGARMREEARQQEEYWALHDMLTDKQDYIQMIPELFDQLHGAAWFTKLELRGTILRGQVSNSVKRTEETWKAAFGVENHDMKSYQPFPLSSEHIIPQKVIHCILRGMLGFFVVSYGQEVLIYSMCQEDHFRHVRQVLVRFRYHNVYCSLDKSQFHRQTAEILDFIISPKGVKLNKTIMNLIMEYPLPTNRKSLQHMIRFLYPYRHFVEHFAIIAEPLIRQLLSSEPFSWGEEEQEAFECLKRAFRRAPILYHPKPHNPFYLETGIIRSTLYASMIQTDEHTGKKVTCAFYSRKLSPIEVEYPKVEMRILPIRAAFMVWYRYLENTEEPIMILLNTEDLASLNNDRLTVLLPGHWVFFFSHFRFDVMELPEDASGRALTRRRSRNQRGFRGRNLRPMLLYALTASSTNQDTESGEEDEEESEQDELYKQTLLQEFLALIPVNQILNSFLAHFSMAQIRAVVLHFFRGLLHWKNLLAVSALLVMLRVRQSPSLLPTHSLVVARPQPRRSRRLLLDSTLIAGNSMATAFAQLLSQMPPMVGANTLPAHELAELFLGPRRWQRNALNAQPLQGLRFTPGFWLTLCEFFGVRANPEEGRLSAPRQHRYLELHVVGDEDVVLREALQDDLQRYRQCGLHDGLQDTSQDAQDDDVQEEALPGDQEEAEPPLRPRNLLDPEVLDVLNSRLLYIQGPDARLTLLSRDQVAQTLTRFLTMVSTQAPPAPAREQARLEELPDSEDNDLD